jgi:hypothetical protein
MEYYNPLANNSKDFLKRNIQSPDIYKSNMLNGSVNNNVNVNSDIYKKIKT